MALKCLKLNFRLVGVVAILVKVSFWDKIRLKFRNFVFGIWRIEKVVLILHKNQERYG